MATALSYLVAGFVGALILIYFLLWSTRAVASLAGVVDPHGAITATPGGLGFVIPVLVYLSLLAMDDLRGAGGMLAGCALIALLGLWDDVKALHPALLIAGQAASVAAILWSVDASFVEIQRHWLLTLSVGAAVFWHVKLFSFTASVDGIAALQCLLYCVGVQVLVLGIPGWVGDLTWLLAGTVLGFLVYNWPPARVRVGNVGSGFLGLLLAVVTLQLWRSEVLPLVTCLILLAGFWFDATYTQCVKMLMGHASGTGDGSLPQRVFVPKLRFQLYQKVTERKGPSWTIVAFAVFHLCWLMPLSWLSLHYAEFDLFMLALAVLPMGIAANLLNAGKPAPEEG